MNQFMLIDITPLVQEWVERQPAEPWHRALADHVERRVSPSTAKRPSSPAISLNWRSRWRAAPVRKDLRDRRVRKVLPARRVRKVRKVRGIPGNLNPGSPYYVQNGTTAQTSASFNIDGNGTVGGTLTGRCGQHSQRIPDQRHSELFADNSNDVMVGPGAGNRSITGHANQLMGDVAGLNLTSGNGNSIIGASAGLTSTTGYNVFLGYTAGEGVTTGQFNTFLGRRPARSLPPAPRTHLSDSVPDWRTPAMTTSSSALTQVTTRPASNSFFGRFAGQSTTTGQSNIFLGKSPGLTT